MKIKTLQKFPQVIAIILSIIAINVSLAWSVSDQALATKIDSPFQSELSKQGIETIIGKPGDVVIPKTEALHLAQNADSEDADGPSSVIRELVTKAELNGDSIIEIEASGALQYTAFKLMNPLRLVLDFPNMKKGELKENLDVKKGLIDSIRSLYFPDAEVLRMEITLKKAAAYDIQKPRKNKIIIQLREAGEERMASAPDTENKMQMGGSERETTTSMTTASVRPINKPEPLDACEPLLQGDKEKISLDFQGANIRNLLRIISDISGFNIIIAPAVSKSSEKIHMRLLDVSWNRAFEVILANSKLGRKCTGDNIIRIDTLGSLAEEEEMVVEAFKRKREEDENERLAQELVTEVVRVNYADIKEVATNMNVLLEKKTQGGSGSSTNSRRGSITVDTRTNTLIISDIPEHVYEMLELIRILDVQTPQVMIESRIVEINKNFSEKLGIAWGFTGGLGNSFGLDGATVVGGEGGNLIANSPFVVDLRPAGTALNASGIGFVLGGLGKSGLLRMQLDALEKESKARILSSPKVTTLDNREAIIKQGDQIPFATTSADGTEVQFVDAELSLKVTPHITSDNFVLMEIEATRNSPDTTLGVAGFTAAGLSTKEVKAEVLVKNGDTTVLGGIYTSSVSETEDAVPFFSKIPFLGYLFKKSDNTDNVTELLVFISPTIITQDQ